jgi:hypothetical protein
MKKGTRSIALMILSVGSIAVLLLCIGFLSVQVGAQQNKQTQQPQVYNPYPPGILPPDSPQEIERVRGEISFIEMRPSGSGTHSAPSPTPVNPRSFRATDMQLCASLAS